MEYIEPKPVEVKPHAKRNKIIIGSVIAAVSLAAVGVGVYFLIDKVFADFDYAELYTYTYERDENNNITGSIIVEADHTVTPPAKLRIPRQLGGHPVVAISDEAFINMDDIVEINFPDTIKSIGKKAFYDCDNLTTFNAPNSLDVLGTDAFSKTKWFSEAPDGELNVGKFLYAYKGSFASETLICSENSTLKEEYPNVTNFIDLSQYSHLSNGVFRDQNKLIAVEIPESVHEVNDATFSGCKNLEKLVIHGEIKSMGADAFLACESLETITGFNYIKSFGKNCFEGCDLVGEYALSEDAVALGEGSFRANKHLTKFTLNNNINAVPKNCFQGCSSLSDVVYSANEYDPAKSHIAYIQDYAFSGTAISYMDVPFNVITIGAGAFSKCPNLTGISLYSNDSGTSFISRTAKNGVYGEWKPLDSQAQGVRVLGKELFLDSPLFEEMVLVNHSGERSNSQEVHIPQTLTNFGASNSNNFKNTSIVKVDLQQVTTQAYVSKFGFTGLTSVSEQLFADAKKLTTVNLGNIVKEIINGAFSGCSELTSITIPSTVNRIDSNSFDGCSKLANVTFVPNEEGKTLVAALKSYIFHNCVSLTSFVVPASIIEISNNAFEGCSNLVSVTLESDKSLNSVGAEAFKDCVKLESINLSTTLRSLGQRAFMNCSKLEKLDFGASIKKLPTQVIANCESLTTLTLRANGVLSFESAADWDENGVVGCPSLTKIIVPAEQVSKYQESPIWSHYTIEAIQVQAV